jgi:hypothetical protein
MAVVVCVGVRVVLRVVVRPMVMGSMTRRLCVGCAHAQQHHYRHQKNLVHRRKPLSRIECGRTSPVSPLADPGNEAKANFIQRLQDS